MAMRECESEREQTNFLTPLKRIPPFPPQIFFTPPQKISPPLKICSPPPQKVIPPKKIVVPLKFFRGE